MKKNNRAGSILLLACLLFAVSCNRNADFSTGSGGVAIPNGVAPANAPGDGVVTTVAKINKLANGDIEYLFNERQARYLVSRDHSSASLILRMAEAALAGKKPIKLISDVPGNLTRLEEPTSAETSKYLEWYRSNLLNTEPERRVQMANIDTLTFNLAEWQNWKVFRLCMKTLPDYATAKKIFDFCKQQTCTFGPTQIQPCIPFSFVRDGCFARAHKMRYIIEQKYGYCSEKVFSYGNLDVKADLSGGCCVGWWYHVAPLVRVKTARGYYLYVIDPGMFTAPVYLSTWLAAQQNTTCDATSNLVEYSIQPSSAYTPSQYFIPVTSYTTDPLYTQTNSDLIYYGNQGTTCGN